MTEKHSLRDLSWSPTYFIPVIHVAYPWHLHVHVAKRFESCFADVNIDIAMALEELRTCLTTVSAAE